MEQANSIVMAMLQSTASATELPKISGKENEETNDFKKLLEEKTQSAKDPLVEDRPKAQTTPAVKKEKTAVQQKEEDPLARIKRALEQGAWVTQPSIGCVTVLSENSEAAQVYQPGEYVMVHMDGHTEIIPTTDLDASQMQQLQQVLNGAGQVIDVSDPKADQMLRATAPGADNSPAELLEQVVTEEVGQVAQQAVEEFLPQTQTQTQNQTQAQSQDQNQAQDDDSQMDVIDVEQAPQRIFHDVKAAPVKVGEVYDAQSADEADVVKQVDTQITQALQTGESTVRVQITPESLGTVTVEITHSVDGVLHVALSAHSSQTRSLLERHAGDLQGLLGSRTQQTVQVDVQRQQESQQSQNQQHSYDGHNGYAQSGQEQRRQQREHANPQDFMQQLRLGLIPTDGEL